MPTTPAGPSQSIMREAWHNFIHGNSKNLSLATDTLKGWTRCRAKGINPYITTAPRVSEEELHRRQLANRELMRVGQPAIDSLYQFITGSGFAVSLSDAEGCFLYVVGDEDTIQASQGSVTAGAMWSENAVGTNCIGTSIYENRPMQIFGYEHYCKIAQRWAGSGCPIHDSDGHIIGTVSLSGEVEKVHLHTLGMAVITARSIEMQMALRRASEQMERSNFYQQAIIDSVSEGLLVVNDQDKITSANSMAAGILNVSMEELLNCDVESLVQDQGVLRKIQQRQEFTDFIVRLGRGANPASCTVTSRQISLGDGHNELLLLVKEMARTKRLAQRLQADEARLRFDDIVGSDIKLRAAIEVASTAAETSANVLILGESGTGKDVFAQAIHNGSARRNGPFVAVNCGAIPRELIASTLFGYEEGAFTGARKGGNLGKFELADGGTIFLDEIGEIPLDIQTVLLRVLETKSFTRVGGKSNISVDVHVIAATNRDLAAEARAMRFRQDLYFRLDVLSIRLPPLRERQGDIMPLVNHFLTQMNKRYRKNVKRFSPEAERIMLAYHWPGNIRELQNIVERAVVLAKDSEITADGLGQLMNVSAVRPAAVLPDTPMRPLEPSYPERRAESEREQLIQLLNECRWNISKAAQKMGVARSTLYRKMEHYRLKE